MADLSLKRWGVLALFCAYGLANQIQYVACTTIVRELQEYFRISSLEVNVVTAMYPILYVILVFPGCYVYERLGLRGGMLIGSGLNAAGSVLKLVAVWIPEFWLLVTAQLLNSVSQIFFLALPPLVASTWFPDDERTLATAVGTLFGFVGMAVGMFYSPQVVQAHPTTHSFGILFGSQCALSVAAFLGVMLFVDPAPVSSPSLTANRRSHQVSVWPIVKKQLSNRNIVALSLSFGFVNGFYTGLAAVLSQIMQPFGISEDQTGVMALVGILCGSAACGVVAPFVDRKRCYKTPLLTIFGVVFVLGVVVAVCMREVTSFLIVGFVLTIAIETTVLPAVPIVMEFCVELTYPDPEAISSSVAIASLSFWSVVGIGVFSVILGDSPTKEDSFTLFVSVVAITGAAILILLIFVKEDLNRLQHERSTSLI